MRATTYPEIVRVKVPEGMLAILRGAASREGQTISEFVRQSVRARLKAGSESAHQPAG